MSLEILVKHVVLDSMEQTLYKSTISLDSQDKFSNLGDSKHHQLSVNLQLWTQLHLTSQCLNQGNHKKRWMDLVEVTDGHVQIVEKETYKNLILAMDANLQNPRILIIQVVVEDIKLMQINKEVLVLQSALNLKFLLTNLWSHICIRI